MKQWRIALVFLVLAALVVGLALTISAFKKQRSPSFGAPRGQNDAIYVLAGRIKTIAGSAIALEPLGPAAYPVYFALASSRTTYNLSDYSRPNAAGLPSISLIGLADLKIGDKVSIKSATNIAGLQKFEAAEISVAKY